MARINLIVSEIYFVESIESLPRRPTFFASDFNCVCSYLAVRQYQRKVLKAWINLQEEYSCLGLHLRLSLRSYGGFFFIPSQASPVSPRPGKRLKTLELSRHASVIHYLSFAWNVILGVFFPSGVGAQATQTILENTTKRLTTVPSIVDLCL